MTRIRFVACLVVLAFLVTGCGPAVIYEQRQTTSEAGWRYEDSLRFAYTIPSTESRYDLLLTIDHGDDFAYENFYLKIHTELPNGKRTTERINIELAGDYGAWNGNCSNDNCAFEVPILRKTRFQEAGDYAITLEQNSRDNPLPEITAVGLKLTETME